MRLVIDLQGAQTGSRFRGIGRYSLSLARAIASLGSGHEILVALSNLFPETIPAIRKELADVLPDDNIRIWHAAGPVRELESDNRWRREASERIREAFLASLRPDVILITSLFEGLGDDAIGSVGVLDSTTPIAVILYDLIPLVNPDEDFRNSELHKTWYARKLRSLERSDILLAISESSRQEALQTSQFAGKRIVNISGAYDSFFKGRTLTSEEKSALQEKLGIRRAFILYTGGADDRKNLPRLIESFAALPTDLRNHYQLVLAGKMPQGHVDSFNRVGKQAGLSDGDVLIPGYVEDADLAKLYATCALFVFPSLHEGFGIPPLEAMACGAPVIGANTTSLPEVIGLAEAMFDPKSVAEMTDRIRVALTNAKFRQRLITHGSLHHRKFTWEKSASVALTALESMVNAKSAEVSELLNFEHTAIFRKRRLKILAIKLDHMGDFILAIPALTKLRARYPYAAIHAIIGSWNVPLARELGIFDKIFAYDFFRRKSAELPKKNAEILAALLSSLDKKYDVAVDLRRPADTRFLLSQVNADVKVGYGTFDDTIDKSLTVVLPQYKDVSFVATPLNKTSISIQMLRVVDAIPADPNDYVTYPEIGPTLPHQAGKVAVFPKAGLAVREWGKQRFEELVRLLSEDSLVEGIDIFFANDLEASEFKFATSPKLIVNVGLPVAELSSALSRNAVCIANNSGGAHLASYLGLTVIAIYSGHEIPSEWGPQFNNGFVIQRAAQCAPCHGASESECPNNLFCLRDISVDDVYRKTMEAIFVAARGRNEDESGGPPGMTRQRNTDSIVRDLLSSISQLGGTDDNSLSDVADAIAKNHPEYSITPDLRSFALNKSTDHKSMRIEWLGFSGIEPNFRWSDGTRASMLFECPDKTPSRGILHLNVDTLGEQRIIASLNGVKVLQTLESGRRVKLRMPVRNLESGFNRLDFDLPDARCADNGDTRKLGIAVREFLIAVEDGLPEPAGFGD
jgi:glycosyltransferase involved in cell wall biosynthesis/ADP-heptose:LPS heptosyltransferase